MHQLSLEQALGSDALPSPSETQAGLESESYYNEGSSEDPL